MNFSQDHFAPRTSGNILSVIDQRPTVDAEAFRLQEIGGQTARIAHDLNNLLSPIIMALELFRPCLKEECHLAILDIAKKSTVRAADLAKQILAFARGVEEERREVDSGALLQEIAAFAQATFPGSIGVKVSTPENLAPVLGAAPQIHRALLNLCTNARDAMPEGGTLTLRAANVCFDSPNLRSSAHRGRYVLFEVSDTGSGIPEAIRERIFDPFFSTKPSGKGTGLGLASVRAIVEQHGGVLSVHSEMGKGTTFHILIPACEAAPNIRIVAA